MSILDKIVYWLGIKGKQQQELTNFLGLGKSTFSAWKSGKSYSYRKYLPEIASFFNMTVDELVGDYGDTLSFNKIVEFLCEQNGETIEQLCYNTGIKKEIILGATGSTAEGLPSEIIKRLADYFFVNEEFLLNKRYFVPCPLCGLYYVINVPSDIRTHETIHKLWKAAVKRFGFGWDSLRWHEVKGHAYDIIHCDTSTIQEIRHACIMMIKSYFSRSLSGSNFSPYHLTFKEYCAALLGQKDFSERIPKSVFNSLVKEYGKNDKIPAGTYYYIPKTQTESNDPIQADVPLTADEKQMLDYFRSFNDEGKEKLLDTASDMAQLDRYKKDSELNMAEKEA